MQADLKLRQVKKDATRLLIVSERHGASTVNEL